MNPSPDLVVLSHLRWVWVWQRPQHLVSRFAARRAAAGARTWFVEEPVFGDVPTAEIQTEDVDGITRVWLVIPRAGHRSLGHPSFDAAGAEDYGALLADLLATQDRPADPDVLLYTPAGYALARQLRPGRLVYDVMDDLASFRNAPEGLRLAQRRLLADADVVFTGGRSLHHTVAAVRRTRCHLFPSGVETGHYAASRALRRQRRQREPGEPQGQRVAGYVGVIDERVDLTLVADLAQALPDWTVRIVGPVAKIDPADLPQGPNLQYPGMVPYAQLPTVMASFDVAVMPFARNEATRSISPTKTLEYLAAGLPVVSTRIADVVADYAGVVHFADDAEEFAAACRQVVQHSAADRDRRLQPIQASHEWSVIAEAMVALIETPDDAATASAKIPAPGVTA